MKFIRIFTTKAVVDLCKEKTAKPASAKAVKEIVQVLRRRDMPTAHINIYSNSLSTLKKAFFSCFTVVEAAGGVVFNDKKEILLIHRRGFWDLPKGKLDKGETLEAAAVREVMEETGLKKVKLKKPVVMQMDGKNVSYHTYRMRNKPMIKPSYWYIMKTKKQKLVPQAEEDIAQAIWIKQKDVPSYYNNMYPAIVEVLESVLAT